MYNSVAIYTIDVDKCSYKTIETQGLMTLESVYTRNTCVYKMVILTWSVAMV